MLRLQRLAGNRAVGRLIASRAQLSRWPRPPTPLPTETPTRPPLEAPPPDTILTAADRDTLEKAAIARIGQAFTAFTTAATAHAAAFKAEEKAKAELAAAAVDIFFGFAAPVFANWMISTKSGPAKLAQKISATLTKKSGEKAVALIAESDFLKESFKAVGKLATTQLKLNAGALFGEEDEDLFARQLRAQFHIGVQALTDAIAAHKLTDKELIATFLAYDVEYTSEPEYLIVLKKTFEEFKQWVRPLGMKIHSASKAGASVTVTYPAWLTVRGKRRMALIAANSGMLSDRKTWFKGWIPPHMEPFVAAKEMRELASRRDPSPGIKTITLSEIANDVPEPT